MMHRKYVNSLISTEYSTASTDQWAKRVPIWSLVIWSHWRSSPLILLHTAYCNNFSQESNDLIGKDNNNLNDNRKASRTTVNTSTAAQDEHKIFHFCANKHVKQILVNDDSEEFCAYLFISSRIPPLFLAIRAVTKSVDTVPHSDWVRNEAWAA